ncbi:hypothetical protein KOW79_003754 [Hemibagrus wyckioides]|uniref:EGF-like domain-containing protein n=1 Tax=Hemibagrus wyckioides TaxID=337641 RepID=A0A9D3P2T5_9TELE|nr:epigen [Hemibagrus wyckioides]KAG7331920.1 hypothetical protein KOW79_003754 [Hemibagrus wyckioides]
MSQCVSLCFALASVTLLHSRTVECAGTGLTLMLNKTQTLNITSNFTYSEPLVLPVHRPCSGEHESLCIHGLCSYPENINNPYCTCYPGYLGTRCEHKNLTGNVFMLDSLEEVIALVCGLIFLLVCVSVLSYCCYRKWGSKPAPPYTNQQNSV